VALLAPVPAADPTADNGTIPAFRPLSFLSALAERVIPDSDEAGRG